MKMNSIISNEKGIALITTLVLSFIGVSFIAIATYMVISSTKISGLENRYLSTLDTAKGVSNYAMNSLDTLVQNNMDLITIVEGGTVSGTIDNCTQINTCNQMQDDTGNNLYSSNSRCLDMTADNIDVFKGYDSCVELLSTVTDPILGGVLFGVEITTQNRLNRLEKSILQFVYLR